MPVRVAADDPLSILLTPPMNETKEQAAMRLAKEAEALRISNEIDRRIQVERDALKNENVLKMLLLGQSESGKSTTLKNIQRIQAPDAWQAERNAWRTVIYLNLVRAVNQILDALAAEVAAATTVVSSPRSEALSMSPRSAASDDEDFDFSISDSWPPSPPMAASQPLSGLSERYAALRLQFSPLRRVEDDLKMALGAAAEDLSDMSSSSNHGMVATPFDIASVRSSSESQCRKQKEFFVRSHSAWKSTVNQPRPDSPKRGTIASDSADVISMFRADIRALWRDDVVRQVLHRQRVILDDSAEYFLRHVDRVASRAYEPTDDDVVRARLRTLGVQEYRIPFTSAGIKTTPATRGLFGKEWRIYDVGGARSMRAAWLPYFDDAHAILFLAPISCFNERLSEDRSVNRLKDSFQLWKSIVGSKILAKCIIILFLNKCDLLDKKLRNGVKVNKFIPRYGDRENTMPVFGRYLRDKFKDYMNEYSPEPRPFYGYLTSVVDTKATSATLVSIQDGILQSHLGKGLML
ncbi:G-protein alpha subunit [Trametopsis cervina]|nr:G-protein alpha subunit [Trametopsis cervina]